MKNFWFNRMIEHWSLPRPQEKAAFLDHIRRADLQIVQTGNFGPLFYGLADDPEAERYWVGAPLVGIQENLDYAAELIAQIQKTGAHVIGQLSMSWHYANHKKNLGLFGAWNHIWTDDLLGSAPCPEAGDGQQRLEDGALRNWPIVSQSYLTYSGCMCNPHWLATLKPMIKKAIDLGVDGFNAHHNFESFCACAYCQDYLLPLLQEQFTPTDLQKIHHTKNLSEVPNISTPHPQCPDDLKPRFELAITRAANLRRKEAFDELFITYGRTLKPNLILAQWYHKYDFNPHDERSLLPAELWARDENYIWYSQGPYRWLSILKQGYLGDMGLPARFVHAAGGGKPFLIMKYDYRRWRVWIAEAAAHHGAGFAFHAGPLRQENESSTNVSPEDHYGPVIRYQRFIAKHEPLLHPAQSWSQIALVYPRRAELEADMNCLHALKRIGRLLEDNHLQFDIILDEQLLDRANDYEMLILPEVLRLSEDETNRLHSYVENGGKLIFTGETGSRQPNGNPYKKHPLASWQTSPPANVLYIPEGPWKPDHLTLEDGTELPTYFLPETDPFATGFISNLKNLLEQIVLNTDAPWFVRVRAWLPEQQKALVLHWVNYQQDEEASIETPIPIGPLQVECTPPAGYTVESVEWLYPEMKAPAPLEHQAKGASIRFTIPTLIVYGLSVLHLKKAEQ